jgi:anti-sigma regulatory factor (Ser/Thr protein kinase)
MPETSTSQLTSSLEFAALPSAVPCARLHARAICMEWGLGDIAETTGLLVSELATNAISASQRAVRELTYQRRPGLPAVALRLSASHAQMLIEVWDDIGTEPSRRATRLLEESGRGLMLVDALAERCGHYVPQHGRGKVVWAEVAIPHASGATRGDRRERYLP